VVIINVLICNRKK